MSELNRQDVGVVSEGRVVMEMDGQNITLLEVKEFTPEVELNKEEIRSLNQRWTFSKVTGLLGSGTLSVHYVSTMWAKIVEDYQNYGKLPQMSIVGSMEDPSTAIGKQTVRIENFMPDSIRLIHLEADDGTTENEMDFTFSGIRIIQGFNDISR